MKTISCFVILFVLISFGNPALSDGLPENFDFQHGGHIKARTSASWYDTEAPIRLVKDNPFYDGSSGLRLKAEMFAGDYLSFKAHYEATVTGGQTREKENELLSRATGLPSYIFSVSETEDDNRLFDLTQAFEREDDLIAYHRLDRLSVTYQPSWGMVRLGRQAVTWGNGLLFNPMDIFNPFSPTAIDKDYKTGEDMAYGQFYTEKFGEWQFLYIPRRDPADNAIEWDKSSLAGKMHYSLWNLEFDFMAAEHYKDEIAGIGVTGNLMNAAWRIDGTWTFLDQDSERSDFATLVANLDYSWIWWKKNFYGFIEIYHNGLGTRKYEEAIVDTAIAERTTRGETFVLAKNYLSGHMNMEIHPLVNIYLTAINNLHDPSGTVQPRVTWDVKQNVRLTLGANVFYGDNGSEYGGISVPSTNFNLKPADSLYLWTALYF